MVLRISSCRLESSVAGRLAQDIRPKNREKIKMSDEPFYKTGNVFKKLMSLKDELAEKDSFELAAHFAENRQEVSTFNHYKYFHIWAALLIKSGRDIKNKLDESLEKLSKLHDSSYNKRKPILRIFEKISSRGVVITSWITGSSLGLTSVIIPKIPCSILTV